MSTPRHLTEPGARAILADIFDAGDDRISALITTEGAIATLHKALIGDLPASLAGTAARALAVKGVRTAADLAAHAERLEADTHYCGARLIIPGDPSWPNGLDQLHNRARSGMPWRAPWCLWAKGNLAAVPATSRLLGIWGHRVGSPLGDAFASSAAKQAVRVGRAIVTTGETGIATAAHEGALGVGATIAIVAGGLDQPEPRGNRVLFAAIAERGLLLSAQPPFRRANGPAKGLREMMIAAACGALAFIEAPYPTAEQPIFTLARELGRTLVSYGNPDHAHRRIGNTRLEQCGALGVRTVADLLGHVSADSSNS